MPTPGRESGLFGRKWGSTEDLPALDIDRIAALSEGSSRNSARLGLAVTLIAAVIFSLEVIAELTHGSLAAARALPICMLLTLALLVALAMIWRQQVSAAEAIRESAERLREGEEISRTAGLTAGEAIISADSDGSITFFNHAAEGLFGYSSHEIFGHPLTDLMPERFKDAHRAGMRRFCDTAESQIVGRSVEMVGLRRDGEEFPIEISVSTGVVRGKRFFAGIARDVTDRKRADEKLRQSEERLRLQVENVKDYAILRLDANGRVSTWNSGAQAVKGYTADEVIGNHFSMFYTPEDVAAGKPAQELKTARDQGRVEDEGWRVRKGGIRFWASVSITALRDDSGNLIGFGKVTRDMTERRNAEDKIDRLNKDLERQNADLVAVNRELEAFTYSIAHDLRAPLRHIHGFSKILSDDFAPKMDEEAKEYLTDILQDTERMGHLIDDLLSLARLSRKEVRFQVVSLAKIVDEVVKEIRSENATRQIEWRIGELPFVTCDAALMRQVYVNLISNAVKYTRPRKTAIVEVGCLHDPSPRPEQTVRTLSPTASEPGGPVLFVKDNGVGFNMKYADKLFGVFQRLHRSEDFEGTGVGLATILRIINKHSGRIWAEAEVDKGATFYFTLATSSPADARRDLTCTPEVESAAQALGTGEM